MTWIFGDLKPRSYRLILADPPWRFSSGPSRNPINHYDCMRIADIAALPVNELCHPEGARLCMWVTLPMLEHGLNVMHRWGFRYSTARVWVKLWNKADEREWRDVDDLDALFTMLFARGTGYEVIGNPELLIHAKVGTPSSASTKPLALIVDKRREHSRKPDRVRDELAEIYEGQRCELFARSQHSGFLSWGNETTKFAEAA